MIKRALVYSYGKVNHENTYRAAANFALQHNCELTGVFVTPDYISFATLYGSEPVNMAQHYYEMQKEFEIAAKQNFTAITKEIGCNAQWHKLSASEAQRKPALYTDVIFVSQPKVEKSLVFNDTDFVDNLVIGTAIPVIVIPENWTHKNLGTHTLLGWKETREAVAAVRHALPLMRKAKKVDIVTIVAKFDQDRDLIAGVEISAYLASHDVNCNYQTVTAAEREPNEAATLQRHAAVHECDLIIIGGYGHSRLRQIILGSVTRELVRNSEVPLLLAH
jgi:nucleotide-binding universal stress UspA family protein